MSPGGPQALPLWFLAIYLDVHLVFTPPFSKRGGVSQTTLPQPTMDKRPGLHRASLDRG